MSHMLSVSYVKTSFGNRRFYPQSLIPSTDSEECRKLSRKDQEEIEKGCAGCLHGCIGFMDWFDDVGKCYPTK